MGTFDFSSKLISLSLIGQTWENKIFEGKQGAFHYLDGDLSDYVINSDYIFGTDFKYNKFQYSAY